MSGFDNDVIYGKNLDLTQADNQNVSENNGLISDGQMFIGSTALNAGGTHVNVGTLISSNGSVTFTYDSPNIDVQANITITGDSGSITGSNLTIFANNTAKFCGSSVLFSMSGTTVLLQVTDSIGNTFIGEGSGNSSVTGIFNTGYGKSCLASIEGGSRNVVIGNESASSLTDGNDNVIIGENCAQNITTGINNTIIGSTVTLPSLVTGSYNLILGYQSGVGAGDNSSNIYIMNSGAVEDNTIRIGTQGNGNGEQDRCFIAGINGATVTGSAVLCATDGQLGTVVSSQRYKKNIDDIPEDISIINLKTVKFNYINDQENKLHFGMIAEDVHEKFPYLCLYDEENKPYTVKYHEICVFLLHEIKKMNTRILELENK